VGALAEKAVGVVIAVSLVGCSSAGPAAAPPDAGGVDGGIDATTTPVDAGGNDAGDVADAVPPPDATPDASDAAAPDAGPCPLANGGIYESPACTECLRGACCAAISTCEGDPACLALDACVNGCLSGAGGDDGGIDAASTSLCAQGCADQATAAVRSEWQAVDMCIQASCSNGGGGPCE